MSTAHDGTALPFGYKVAWLAFRGVTPQAVIAALDLSKVHPSGWDAGIATAYEEDAFVTPSIDGWVLVVCRYWLGLTEDDPPGLLDRLCTLSRALDTEVQYFASHRVVELHAWGRAERGVLQRAYAYLGERGEVLFDVGAPTDAEAGIPSGDDGGPGEEHVMELASAWSLDPQTLDGREVGPGWVGDPGL